MSLWGGELCGKVGCSPFSCTRLLFFRTFIAHFFERKKKSASRSNGLLVLCCYSRFSNFPRLSVPHILVHGVSHPLFVRLLSPLVKIPRPPFPPTLPLWLWACQTRAARLVTLLCSSVPKYPPALSSVRRKTEEGGWMSRAGRMDGWDVSSRQAKTLISTRPAAPRVIYVGFTGTLPQSRLRLTHSAVSAPELVFHHTLTDRRATVYHLRELGTDGLLWPVR